MLEDFEANHLDWKKEYNLNDPHIDLEHQTIFAIARKAEDIQKFEDTIEQNNFLKNVLRELHRYTRKHFKSEEEYMQKHNYPGLQEHILLHQTLLDQINFIIINLNILDTQTAKSKLYYFVQKIFVEHIKTHDAPIAKYVVKTKA